MAGARRLALVGALAAVPGIALAQTTGPAAPARVWQDTMTIPTYEVGAPDPNPPFDFFERGPVNYPYTLLTNLTDHRVKRVWRTLNLENEYLRCTVLPDLGGHLYRCTDKVNGAEMFYANSSIKFARIAYRGAWAALGVEFNFPVSHNWMTVSPVDYATGTGADGSAWVQVANTDRVTGMRWQVTLTLRPGRAVLEQRTTLSNPSDVRHRFYWWTNAGVRVWDDSHILYPMKYTAGHGMSDIDTWPVNRAGLDLSVVKNQTAGPVSRFAYGSREPFMAVYHPHTQAGVVHYSAPTDLPGKKIWSWGVTPDGLAWRSVLSDDSSAYVEIQAGLFRNQETYGFLNPHETASFTEYWLPIRDLGGLARADPDAALNLTRSSDGTVLTVALNVTTALPRATVSIADSSAEVAADHPSLSPATTYTQRFTGLTAADRYTLTLRDSAGGVVLRHTEGRYDLVPDSEIRTGPVAGYQYPPPQTRSDGDFAALGEEQESQGRLLDALATYRDGLTRFPQSLALNRAAGILEVGLKHYAAAVPHLTYALSRVTTDHEAWYYAGLAYLELSQDAHARDALEHARAYGAFRVSATIQLARLAALQGGYAEALDLLEPVVAETGSPGRLGAIESALLRSRGRRDEARRRLAGWLAADPSNSFLRYEATRLGADDPTLEFHLAADPERILDIAVEYMRFGLYADAYQLLSHDIWPSGSEVVTEPGMRPPGAYPLIAYYRAYCAYALGLDGSTDLQEGSLMPTLYVFPSRPESFNVLRAALAVHPRDATARFLLGSLLMSAGLPDSAMVEWEAAARLNPRIPTLQRNLALTILKTGGPVDSAIALLTEATHVDSLNVEVYLDLVDAMRRAGRSADERAAVLLAYPKRAPVPPALAFTTARTLAEAARFDDAERQLRGRFFSRAEGGEDVRQVYLELRIARARWLAAHARCSEALRVLDHLADRVRSLDFTREGLQPLVDAPPVRDSAQAVRASCGGGR
jgi:tetratricopeptide (TPR) repeat protein